MKSTFSVKKVSNWHFLIKMHTSEIDKGYQTNPNLVEN